MNGKEMLESMSYVDEKYIEDAEIIPKRRLHWQPVAAAAACLALVLVGVWQAAPAKDAAPEMAEAAVYSGGTDELMPMVGAAVSKSIIPPEMTVTVVEQDGVTLRCTVNNPGTGSFEIGQEITVLLPGEDAEELSGCLRISYTLTESDGTVAAVEWEKAE